MTKTGRPFLSFAALRLKWQAFGFVLIALGRAIVRLQRAGGRGAWEMAQHLDTAARAAACHLSAELSDAYVGAPPTSDEEIAALEHLAIIRTLFLALAMFARHMMRKLAGRAEPEIPCTEISLFVCLAKPARTNGPAYLDSG